MLSGWINDRTLLLLGHPLSTRHFDVAFAVQLTGGNGKQKPISLQCCVKMKSRVSHCLENRWCIEIDDSFDPFLNASGGQINRPPLLLLHIVNTLSQSSMLWSFYYARHYCLWSAFCNTRLKLLSLSLILLRRSTLPIHSFYEFVRAITKSTGKVDSGG